MNPIAGNAVVSCYVDVASFMMMILLLTLSERMRKSGNALVRIFYTLMFCVMINCIFPFIYNAMYMQTAPWCHTAAVIAKTLRESLNVVIVMLWLFYVDQKLYGIGNPHLRQYWFLTLPFAGLLILLIQNLFTGNVFTFSQSNTLQPKPLLYVIFGAEFVAFLFSAVIVRLYDRRSTKNCFLRVSPMLLSIVFATGITVMTHYDVGILGYVIGIILLCFSLITQYRFEDRESGLYNRSYLAYLFNMALAGKSEFRSALMMELGGNIQAGWQILRDTLHREYDIIRAEEKKCVMFSGIESRSALQLLSTQVEEAVAKYNDAHPDEAVVITVYSRMRTAEQDSFSFLRSTMQEKDAGDPVRGVVSMISELDRLDKELELAADIQFNMLPMNFPPFPDRTEFDLYASMTPAKEVGGDFYDFFLVDHDHLALVIADVSGKGIPAALFMMVSKTLIKNQLMSGCDPAAALEHVNLQLCERNSSNMFVTVWVAVLEIPTGKGTACNAGHENPAILRTGGGFELLKYRHDTVLGISGRAKYHNREFTLGSGDCIFVYTDGVPEAGNAALEMFGAERLITTLNQNIDKNPEQLIHMVRREVDLFADNTPQFDDITMLCLRWA